jgi:hypothetical protein
MNFLQQRTTAGSSGIESYCGVFKMGNAATTLTPLQSAEVTRQLKIEYEKCIKQGLDSEAATALMTKKYDSVLKAVQASPLDIITSNAKRLKRGTSKAVDNKPKRRSLDAKPSGSSRHKSFDEKPVKPDQPTKLAADTTLAQSESAPLVAVVSESEEDKKKAEPPTGMTTDINICLILTCVL